MPVSTHRLFSKVDWRSNGRSPRLFSKIKWRSKWEVANFLREVAKVGDFATLAYGLTHDPGQRQTLAGCCKCRGGNPNSLQSDLQARLLEYLQSACLTCSQFS
jgi:hypothetical protein